MFVAIKLISSCQHNATRTCVTHPIQIEINGGLASGASSDSDIGYQAAKPAIDHQEALEELPRTLAPSGFAA